MKKRLRLLQLWQKNRLIDIIEILTHHRGKIRYSVWYLFYLLFHHAMKFNQFTYAKLRLYFETTKVFTAFLVKIEQQENEVVFFLLSFSELLHHRTCRSAYGCSYFWCHSRYILIKVDFSWHMSYQFDQVSPQANLFLQSATYGFTLINFWQSASLISKYCLSMSASCEFLMNLNLIEQPSVAL